jgi:hypothetical protein
MHKNNIKILKYFFFIISFQDYLKIPFFTIKYQKFDQKLTRYAVKSEYFD